MALQQMSPGAIVPVEPPVQFPESQGLEIVQVDNLVGASKARAMFSVDGRGLTVAVLDTGLRTTHVDFAGRVVAQRNYTADNGGNVEDATDGQGHGTNVGGIICAGADHTGIAPAANIIPLKVLGNKGGGSFAGIRDALQWVLDNHQKFNITVASMSLGDGGNYVNDSGFEGDAIQAIVRRLRDAGVVVVVAAGNDYFTHDSRQGMGYPAILRDTVSVGAVYDADEGEFSYGSGAVAHSTAPDRITPFSQRLHTKVGGKCQTDIFAPGAPVTSSGIANDHGESIQHGTSQATPVTSGVVLLVQQYHLMKTGKLPAVGDVVTWLRRGGVRIVDGDDENDNVAHTGLAFTRVSAVGALEAVRRHLQKAAFASGAPLRPPA